MQAQTNSQHPSQAIGVDLGGTNIKAALVTPSGDVSEQRTTPTRADLGAEQVMDALAALIRDLSNHAEMHTPCIGIAIPGETDSTGRIWRLPNIAGFEGVMLADALRTRLADQIAPASIVMDNDAICAAFGEWRVGASRSYANQLHLTLGTGIGGGLILNGQLYRGRDGFAAEIGHVATHHSGRSCVCGATGCMEAYACARGILQTHRELGGKDAATVAELCQQAEAGEALALKAFAQAGHELGHGLASILNVLNLDALVFSGGIRAALPFMLNALRATLEERCMGEPVSKLPILTTALGDHAGTIGAALLALDAAGHQVE